MTKLPIVSTLLVAFALLGTVQAQQQVMVIPDGTVMTIHAREELSGNSLHTGDAVHFVVNEPVKVRNAVVVAGGADVIGTVTKARHSGGFGRNAVLDLSIDRVQAVDGSWIRLRATSKNEGASNGALAVGVTLLVSVVGVFIQGHDAILPTDKNIEVYSNNESQVALNGAPGAIPVAVATTPALVPQTTTPGTTGGLTGAQVTSVLVCTGISPTGDPVGVGSTFPSTTKQLKVWWSMKPLPSATAIDIRLYQDSQLVSAGEGMVHAQATHGTASLSPPHGRFSPGSWHVDVVQNGQVLSTQTFDVQ